MDYIEQLNFIFSVNEDICGGFTSKEAQIQWNVLTKDLGFQEITGTGQGSSYCGLYLPPQERMGALRAEGWPDVIWEGNYPEFGGRQGQAVRQGQKMASTHGSSGRSIGGVSGEMKRRFGITLADNSNNTYNAWLLELSKEIGGMEPIYQYVREKYPKEYRSGREKALAQLWKDSLSRSKVTAEKMRADVPELFDIGEKEQEKRKSENIASFEAVLRTIGNGSRWFFTNQDLTSLVANPSEENLDKVLQNLNMVNIARGEVRGPTTVQMTAALDDYEKRLQQAGDEILDKLS